MRDQTLLELQHLINDGSEASIFAASELIEGEVNALDEEGFMREQTGLAVSRV